MSTALPGVLTLRELSQKLDINESTLRSWRHRGYGPASFKVGVTVVYRSEDVDAWLAERQGRSA